MGARSALLGDLPALEATCLADMFQHFSGIVLAEQDEVLVVDGDDQHLLQLGG